MWPDLPRGSVILPEDAEARHYGAFHDGVLIAVGSFFEEEQAVRLRKLAVEPGFQGQGVARVLLERAMQDLRAQGCTSMWCDARVSASEFYTRNGFQLGDRVFQKNGLDYVIAKRDL